MQEGHRALLDRAAPARSHHVLVALAELLHERRELAEVVRAVCVAHEDVAPAHVRESVEVRASETSPRRLQHARAVRQRDLRGSVVRAVHDEHLTHDACGFEALATPVDELADGDLLVEGGNDDRELGFGDVVRGHEEPNVWVEPIAGSVHGGHGPSLADGHRASTLAGRRDGSRRTPR